MNDDLRTFLFTAMPVMIACFFTIALTLICTTRWVTALVQIPVWGALLWWVYALKNYYSDLLA